MSWGRSAAGAPQQVIEQVEGWAAVVEAYDWHAGTANAVVEKHRAQVDRCVRTVTEFAGSLPVGYHMQATAGGAVNDTGTPEMWTVTLRAYRPVPIVTARVIE